MSVVGTVVSDTTATRTARLPVWTEPARSSPALARVALWVMIVVGTAARIPGLGRALTDAHAFRQTQTAYTIREIARHGPHLLHPMLPVFGPPWTVAFEMPIAQAVAAIFVKLGLSSDVAGRLLGLLTFQLTALLLFLLVRRWVSARAALVAVLLLEACPLAVQFGYASLIEFSATASALGALIALSRWYDAGRWWWLVVGSAASVLAWLIKATTAVPWTFPAIAAAYVFARVDWRNRYRRAVVGLAAVSGLGLVAGLWWTRYADQEKAKSPFTSWLTSHALQDWNFGTLHQRAVFANWRTVIGFASDLVVGTPVLFVLAVVALWFAAPRVRLLTLSLALVPLVAIGTFFNLYFRHNYYLSAVLPALVAVLAAAVEVVLQRLPSTWPTFSRFRLGVQHAALAVIVLLVWTTSWLTSQGREVALSFLTVHPAPPPLGVQLGELTPRGSQIVIVGCDWDPQYLYYADRRGLMYLPGHAAGVDAAGIAREYQYVASCLGSDGLSQLPPGLKLTALNAQIWRIVGVEPS